MTASWKGFAVWSSLANINKMRKLFIHSYSLILRFPCVVVSIFFHYRRDRLNKHGLHFLLLLSIHFQSPLICQMSSQTRQLTKSCISVTILSINSKAFKILISVFLYYNLRSVASLIGLSNYDIPHTNFELKVFFLYFMLYRTVLFLMRLKRDHNQTVIQIHHK